jgi:hypothetical protein
MPNATSPRIVPVPAADPLFVDTLRAGLESYVRGDYRRASEYLLDAAAVAGARPEAKVWAVAGATLQALLTVGELVSRDAAHRVA